VRGKARLETRPGCNLFQHRISEPTTPHVPIPPLPASLNHNGARPSAASAVADAAARRQWPRPPSPEPAIPAAPCTTIPHMTHAVRRTRDTGDKSPVVSIARGYLGGHIEGSAEEEDVIPKEATTVYGGQGPQRHHLTRAMLGMWESQALASAVSILCRWYVLPALGGGLGSTNYSLSPQDQYPGTTELGHPTANDEASQANGTRAT
jgi:hypothetical protein